MKTLSLRDCDLAVLRRTFRRFPCVREVRLFGSRATGTARRASDIDLAISAPDATADQWLELTEALEAAPIIYEFDLVRTERAHSRRLRETNRPRRHPHLPGEPHGMSRPGEKMPRLVAELKG